MITINKVINHQPKKPVFWAIVGSILIMFGITITLLVGLTKSYFYLLIIALILNIAGILLIAWMFGDYHEY